MNEPSNRLSLEKRVIEEKMTAIMSRKQEIGPDEEGAGQEFAIDLDQTGLRWASMQLAGLNGMTDFLAEALGVDKEKIQSEISHVLSKFQTLDGTPIIQIMDIVQNYCLLKMVRMVVEKTVKGEIATPPGDLRDVQDILNEGKEASQRLISVVLGGKEAYSGARDEKFGLFHTFEFTLKKLKESGKKLYAVSDSHKGKFLRRLRAAGIDQYFDLALSQKDPLENQLPHYVAERAKRGAYNVACKFGELPNIKPEIPLAKELLRHGVKTGVGKEVTDYLSKHCIMVGDNVTKDGGFALHNGCRYYKAAFGRIPEEIQQELALYGNQVALSKNIDIEDEKTIKIIKETRMKILKFPTDILVYSGIDFNMDELFEWEIQRATELEQKRKTGSVWSRS